MNIPKVLACSLFISLHEDMKNDNNFFFKFLLVCQDKESQLARIELRLIQSKNCIENPEICLFAESLTSAN